MKLSRMYCLIAIVIVASAASPPAGVGAQARARRFDPELLLSGDLIRYRDLNRDDFLGVDPPEEATPVHGQLGAVTCVFLTTDPDTYIRASADPEDQERGLVRAQIEDLGFLAYMDRDCSWWNPAPLGLPDAYILQHEQIHFALFEIAARRLNRRLEDLTQQMQTVSDSQQRALREVHRQVDAEMQRAVDEVLARGNDFDRETSRTYRQDRQNWWWQTISRELDRLAEVDDLR